MEISQWVVCAVVFLYYVCPAFIDPTTHDTFSAKKLKQTESMRKLTASGVWDIEWCWDETL